MIVVDASIAVRVLSREAGADAALARLAGEDARCAPDWIRLEMANAMSRKVRENAITASVGQMVAAGVTTLVEVQHDSLSLLEDAFTLSTRIGHAMYDCLYLALALRNDCTLVTGDDQFAARAAQGGFASSVELLV